MNETQKTVLQILNDFEIQNVDSFKDEVNSITFIELIVELETTFDIVVDDEDMLMDKMCSFDKLCHYIEGKVNDV